MALRELYNELQSFYQELDTSRGTAYHAEWMLAKVASARQAMLNNDFDSAMDALTDVVVAKMDCKCHERDSSQVCPKCKTRLESEEWCEAREKGGE